jgi:hypothetical protein
VQATQERHIPTPPKKKKGHNKHSKKKGMRKKNRDRFSNQ